MAQGNTFLLAGEPCPAILPLLIGLTSACVGHLPCMKGGTSFSSCKNACCGSHGNGWMQIDADRFWSQLQQSAVLIEAALPIVLQHDEASMLLHCQEVD